MKIPGRLVCDFLTLFCLPGGIATKSPTQGSNHLASVKAGMAAVRRDVTWFVFERGPHS